MEIVQEEDVNGQEKYDIVNDNQEEDDQEEDD